MLASDWSTDEAFDRIIQKRTDTPMSTKKRKRKRNGTRQGHYCWSCGRQRPNEKFSGRNHSRHLCRDCSKLGREELEYRSALGNLDRCLTDEGMIRRKGRKQFEQFLEHENPRVRAVAEELLANDLMQRALTRAAVDLEETLLEAHLFELDGAGAEFAEEQSIHYGGDDGPPF